MPDFLKPIKIKVFYDKSLQEITKKDFEESFISENLSFVNFLHFILSSYPQIAKTFMPGTLGFAVNGKAPESGCVLKDGDAVSFSVFSLEDMRKNLENQLSDIINYFQVNTTAKAIKKIIFDEEGQDDFNNLTRLFSEKIGGLNQLNKVLQIVNGAWNLFPHKSLNGLSPMEKLSQTTSR